MNKLIEQHLLAVLEREGLEPKPGDLEQFSEIISVVRSCNDVTESRVR